MAPADGFEMLHLAPGWVLLAGKEPRCHLEGDIGQITLMGDETQNSTSVKIVPPTGYTSPSTTVSADTSISPATSGGPVFEPLHDPAYLALAAIEPGTVVWQRERP